MRTPRMVLTSDRWSRSPIIIFDDDLDIDCIPDDWVNDRYQRESEYDETVTKESILEMLIDELHEENSSVDEYWIDDKVCRCGGNYFKYDDDGNAKYILEYEREG